MNVFVIAIMLGIVGYLLYIAYIKISEKLSVLIPYDVTVKLEPAVPTIFTETTFRVYAFTKGDIYALADSFVKYKYPTVKSAVIPTEITQRNFNEEGVIKFTNLPSNCNSIRPVCRYFLKKDETDVVVRAPCTEPVTGFITTVIANDADIFDGTEKNGTASYLKCGPVE
jgi:hypothetical protein